MRLLVLLLALIAAPLAAQAPTPGADLVARDIVATAFAPANGKSHAVAQFESSFVASFTGHPQGAALAKQRPDILQTGVNAGKAEFERQFDMVVVPAMTDAIVRIYVTNFTPLELDAIRSYYQTSAAKRYQASFTSSVDPSEVAEARSDPTVVSYRNSALGLKETALSSQIAEAMVAAATSSTAKFMPQVTAKVVAALQAASARSQRVR